MTNIWKDTFEEIRKPHFTIEDPYTIREKKEKEEKEGKAKRWWDDDGDGVGYEPGEVSGKFKKKKKVKESVENIFEVDKTKAANEKIDVMKGGKRNKVTINPPMKEQVEEWVNELVDEGYDLSKFTWDEMSEIYETAELEEQVPAAGDAQTVNATDQKTLSAKRRLAQAQIRADLARVQLQKSAMSKNESFDSIVEYLNGRKDIFENLEEGVFDPKKTKLRPASERTKRTVTDAQRRSAKKEAERTAQIHSKGETVLAGLRSSGTTGKVKTSAASKADVPEANRKVKGRYDKLASAANKVLRDIKKNK